MPSAPLPPLRPGSLPAGFVLNIHKEIPWTSHDAVQRVRRILGIRQVGHAGSLDPLATGVLVVAVGRATKLVSHLMALPKSYRGTIYFGRRTSTADAGGEILEEREAPEAPLETLREAARSFHGEILQVPPMVSAIKHEGRRLYELARKGLEVEREARRVHVERFEIVRAEWPRVDFEVDCGRGTYVRTLAEDLAARLGTIAFVENLLRTRVGHFRDEDACRIASAPGSEPDGLAARAVPMGEALAHLPGGAVDGHWLPRLRHGATPPLRWVRFGDSGALPAPGSTVRLLGPGGELVALAVVDLLPGPADRPVEESTFLRLERVI